MTYMMSKLWLKAYLHSVSDIRQFLIWPSTITAICTDIVEGAVSNGTVVYQLLTDANPIHPLSHISLPKKIVVQRGWSHYKGFDKDMTASSNAYSLGRCSFNSSYLR
jgi:hypothetical protein